MWNWKDLKLLPYWVDLTLLCYFTVLSFSQSFNSICIQFLVLQTLKIHKTQWSRSLTCRHTRDFSSRYCSILAPSIAPRLLKWMSMYFPKRLELSLRMVLAFPKAERMHNHTVGGWEENTGTQTELISINDISDSMQLIWFGIIKINPPPANEDYLILWRAQNNFSEVKGAIS